MRKAAGLHINSDRANAAAADYIRAARPSVVKWLTDGMGNGDLIRVAKSVGALTVGRVYVPGNQQSLDSGPSAAMLGKIRDAARRWPDIDAWEGYNEAFQGAGDMARRAAFDIDLMNACAGLGRKAVIGSFSVGQPQLGDGAWAAYLPALAAAAAGGHYVGLHEYGGPAMQWGAGANQMAGLVGGQWVNRDPAERPGVDGYFCLRYRKAVAEWRSLGLATIPRVIITETGLDDIQPRPDVGQRSGFLTYRGTPWESPIPFGDFADQIAWYCRRWAEDDYIVGGVVFCWGDASGDWGAFDLADAPGVTGRLIDNMKALTDVSKPSGGGGTVADAGFGAALAAKVDQFKDVRASLPQNPNGPNGAFDSRSLAGIDTIAVHHTAGPRGQTPEQIARFHIDSRGYAGIGYHVLIREGVVYYVGDIGQARACCKDQNHRVLCVCVTGDYETEGGDNLAAADSSALFAVVGAIQGWAGSVLKRRLAVKGHCEVPGQSTACPGRRLMAVLPALAVLPGGPTPPAADGAGGALRAASIAEQRAKGIQLNASAALQRAIRADGLTVTTNEGRLSVAGATYAWQRAEPLAGGAAWVYYCPVGEWGKVKRIPG